MNIEFVLKKIIKLYIYILLMQDYIFKIYYYCCVDLGELFSIRVSETT